MGFIGGFLTYQTMKTLQDTNQEQVPLYQIMSQRTLCKINWRHAPWLCIISMYVKHTLARLCKCC